MVSTPTQHHPEHWTQFKGWCKKNCDVAPMSSLIITLSTFIFILSFNMYCLRLFTGLITLLTDISLMCTTWIWIVSYPSLLLYNHTFHIEIIFFRHVLTLPTCTDWTCAGRLSFYSHFPHWYFISTCTGFTCLVRWVTCAASKSHLKQKEIFPIGHG